METGNSRTSCLEKQQGVKKDGDSVHHRRPGSQGGNNSGLGIGMDIRESLCLCRYNISYVPRDLHNAWHTLFYIHNPETIVG